MIVYDLACDRSHRFEGWFGSADDFDQQLADKVLTCPVCGSAKVLRRPSAAYVNTGAVPAPARQPHDGRAQHDRHNQHEQHDRSTSTSVSVPQQYANIPPEMIARVVEHIVKNTEDVGNQFPEEARKIHYKEAPERQIRGTASPKEVDALRDEGIEVMSLPLPAHLLNKPH